MVHFSHRYCSNVSFDATGMMQPDGTQTGHVVMQWCAPPRIWYSCGLEHAAFSLIGVWILAFAVCLIAVPQAFLKRRVLVRIIEPFQGRRVSPGVVSKSLGN